MGAEHAARHRAFAEGLATGWALDSSKARFVMASRLEVVLLDEEDGVYAHALEEAVAYWQSLPQQLRDAVRAAYSLSTRLRALEIIEAYVRCEVRFE